MHLSRFFSNNKMATNDSTFLVGKRFPNRLFVGGLPPNAEAVELAEFFSHFGTVTDTKVIADENNISKGYGFVTFRSVVDVRNVCQKGTLFFKNKKLNIGPAVKKEGPMIRPEMVIVPSAPSKGTFFYPEPAQYVPVEPIWYTVPTYNNDPYIYEQPCYQPCCFREQPAVPEVHEPVTTTRRRRRAVPPRFKRGEPSKRAL